MKILRNSLIGLVALVVLFFAIGAILPSESRVERSVVMQASQEEVFDLVGQHQNFQRWSPWAKLDPKMEIEPYGPPVGIGSMISWKSDNPKVGNGSSTYVEWQRPSYTKLNLRFDQGRGMAEFQIDPAGEGMSEVTWRFTTSNEGIMGRYFGVMLDGILGPVYEEGLQDLKILAEKTAKQK